ncbi:unnamed protein product, partial [Polarella glacialis]
MIRAPVINTVLNSSRTLRQLLGGKNAFEEAVSRSAPARTGSSGGAALAPPQALHLRDVSSAPLWFLACARARRAVTHAISAGEPAEVERGLSRLGELLRLGGVLSHVGALGPAALQRRCERVVDGWYDAAVRGGLSSGLVVPGKTKGVPARRLLHIRIEASAHELMDRMGQQSAKLHAAVAKGLAGNGHLDLRDEDLIGLRDRVKSVWGSTLGSAAVWRKTKYRVPIGKDAVDKIGSFCQDPVTRQRVFEAYYAGFGSDVDEAALELLRTRKQLAIQMGFKSGTAFELAPMSISDEVGARQLMDRCWRDAQPALLPALRKMGELAVSSGGAAPSRGKSSTSTISHADEAFYRALVTREADTWKLAEYLPDTSLPRLLEVVGKAYSVTLREVQPPKTIDRMRSGWHKSVRVYEVSDGSPASAVVRGMEDGRNRLGFVYLDLYQRTSLFGRPAVELAGAQLLCSGHAYLSMNLAEPSMGQGKLFNPEEIVAITHELGHAVHMLCHQGSPQEFEDLPLDVLELPSTLAETIALQPGCMAQYAQHYASGGPPPEALVRSCQRDVHFFVRYLQSASVSLGLSGEAFDPMSATPAELRAESVALWQRYSPVTAHPSFTPFAGEAGLYTAQGPNQLAYLLCYLRVDAILHSSKPGSTGSASVRSRRDGPQRWLNPEFASRLRSQLLDKSFSGSERLASLWPLLAADSKSP